LSAKAAATGIAPAPLEVLWIGDASASELAPTRDLLAHAGCHLHFVSNWGAMAQLESDVWPDLILLVQQVPGQFSSQDVASLVSRWPLARVVILAGSWCEGELRSHPPLPVAERWYAHQAPARMAAELQHWQAGHAPSWSLPATVTSEERTLWQARIGSQAQPATPIRIDRPVSVLIVADDAASAAWLADACRQPSRRVTTLALNQDSNPSSASYDLLIWDLPDHNWPTTEQLTQLPAAGHLCFLVNFPRESDFLSARSFNAHLISKPLSMTDLAQLYAPTLTARR